MNIFRMPWCWKHNRKKLLYVYAVRSSCPSVFKRREISGCLLRFTFVPSASPYVHANQFCIFQNSFSVNININKYKSYKYQAYSFSVKFYGIINYEILRDISMKRRKRVKRKVKIAAVIVLLICIAVSLIIINRTHIQLAFKGYDKDERNIIMTLSA